MRARLVKENINDLFVPKSKEDIIKQLSNLSQKEKDGKLIKATYNGQLDLVKLLIEAGANVNTETSFGDTALIFASRYGQLDIVKLLIEKGADINAKNQYGSTALMRAYTNGYIDIVELLKKHGAKE